MGLFSLCLPSWLFLAPDLNKRYWADKSHFVNSYRFINDHLGTHQKTWRVGRVEYRIAILFYR